MTVVFISHSSKDKKIALKPHSWLRDFQFIEDVRIDLKEVRAGVQSQEYSIICLSIDHAILL
jgi:hypothetical protein